MDEVGGNKIITTVKKPTLRQVQEPTADEAEEVTEPEKEVKPRETAADRRNFYRKQAGWPPLRVK